MSGVPPWSAGSVRDNVSVSKHAEASEGVRPSTPCPNLFPLVEDRPLGTVHGSANGFVLEHRDGVVSYGIELYPVVVVLEPAVMLYSRHLRSAGGRGNRGR